MKNGQRTNHKGQTIFNNTLMSFGLVVNMVHTQVQVGAKNSSNLLIYFGIKCNSSNWAIDDWVGCYDCTTSAPMHICCFSSDCGQLVSLFNLHQTKF
jgi:hypothetical protein